MNNLTEFSNEVIKLIKKIPKGKVATYGFIAKLAGKPRGARAVSWILHSCSKNYKLPWQRVIKSGGQLPFSPSTDFFFIQKTLLEKEGILIINGKIDLKKYLWNVQNCS